MTVNSVRSVIIVIYEKTAKAMSSVSTLTHVQRVRILYKTCLRLHRGMPTQMQIIGDAYVKDEFKRFVKDFNVLLEHYLTFTLFPQAQKGQPSTDSGFHGSLGGT